MSILDEVSMTDVLQSRVNTMENERECNTLRLVIVYILRNVCPTKISTHTQSTQILLSEKCFSFFK